MVVLKLRSPLVAALGVLVVLVAAGLALFGVEHVWTVRSEVAVSGSWGSQDIQFGRGAGADGRPRGPQAISVDGHGNLVVADSLNYRLLLYSRAGKLLTAVPLPVAGVPSQTEDERAAVYGRLVPCLAWSSGFQPEPEIAAPARQSAEQPSGAEPVTSMGTSSPDEPATGRVKGSPPGSPYITDMDLGGGSWAVNGAGHFDAAGGPDIYVLAGWEGALMATDAAGTLKWTRDLSTSSRFEELRDPYDPQAPVTPASWAGFMLDLDTLPGGGLVVAGYELLTDKLVFFVRALSSVEGEVTELAAYQLLRDGTVKVDHNLPIDLEVESVAVGTDGLIYTVAAAPPRADETTFPSESVTGTTDDEAAPPLGSAPTEGASQATPFTREIWAFSPEGTFKNKLELQFQTYTRHLRLIGVDEQGMLYVRVGGAGKACSVVVFDGEGRLAASVALPEDAEIADTCLGGDGHLYVSVATDTGYQVLRYTIAGRGRITPRWWGRN